MAKTDCQFKIGLQLKEAIIRNDKYITHINIPCGKCGRCLQRRKMEWSFRMMNELIHSKTAYFVTLTYDPENVPYNKYGQKTLVPTRAKDLEFKAQEEGRKRKTKVWKNNQVDRSLQGFFKRLRQNHKRTKDIYEKVTNGLTPKDKIRYFACGEYGEQRHRPHYHAIIFNASEKAIMKSWTLGGVHIVKATEANINYTMKYVDKRYGTEQAKNKEPEFSTMSEGIGENYINKFAQWHRSNLDVLYVQTETGIRIPMPKYYRDKIFSDIQRQEQVIIVTDILEEIKQEEIGKKGMARYTKEKNELARETERRFKKKIKKRIVD